MQFFLDTADIEEIRAALGWGILDGVTTNPSLVAKTGRRFDDVKAEILELVKGPVSLEVTATDYEGMMREARALAAEGSQVVVKIPLTPAGIHATATCTDEGIKTNVTLCFSANQALLAAKAGATYISPFVGRMDDIGNPGMDVVADILQIYENYGYTTQVLAASLRHPAHVLEAARLGSHVATMPFKVIEQLFKHPMTDLGLARFLADWQKVPE
ncbi:MAG TPA: fructose-6-phosphate aldolase [Myxococcales bacterium]|nr:fructose-6-phosphate aldolase [Myxococcales bacterium]HAN32614.1 fructose-6-phosphate aldolase [Myxococcales bacterium]